MIRTCTQCHQEADCYEGYAECKGCHNARSRKRYHEHYAKGLRAARRVAHAGLKARRGPEHSVTDLAYMAGLIDGEGCILINHKGKRQRYTLIVTVSNTSRLMLDWITARWRGHMHVVKGSEAKNRRIAWRWSMSSDLALHFLDEILPYMVVKRRQALLARRYQRYVQYRGRHGVQATRAFALQTRFYDMLRQLNQRGFHAGNPQWE